MSKATQSFQEVRLQPGERSASQGCSSEDLKKGLNGSLLWKSRTGNTGTGGTSYLALSLLRQSRRDAILDTSDTKSISCCTAGIATVWNVLHNTFFSFLSLKVQDRGVSSSFSLFDFFLYFSFAVYRWLLCGQTCLKEKAETVCTRMFIYFSMNGLDWLENVWKWKVFSSICEKCVL